MSLEEEFKHSHTCGVCVLLGSTVSGWEGAVEVSLPCCMFSTPAVVCSGGGKRKVGGDACCVTFLVLGVGGCTHPGRWASCQQDPER